MDEASVHDALAFVTEQNASCTTGLGVRKESVKSKLNLLSQGEM